MNKQIIIMRHAEKPDNDTQHLSKVGYQRADYIATYIPYLFGKPDIIFATAATEHSMRPILTVMPLWKLLGDVPLNISVDDTDIHKLSVLALHAINSNLNYKLPLICWHHGQIPDLMKELGSKHHNIPDPWPDDDFSSVYVLTFEGHHAHTERYEMPF